MNLKNLNFKLVLVYMLGALFFTSCDDNSSEIIVEGQGLLEEEAIALIESDDISDEIGNIVDDILVVESSIGYKDEAAKNPGGIHRGGIPDCAEKTVEEDDTTKTITIDFGEGCETRHGHVLSGKIIVIKVHDEEAGTSSVTHTFDEFFFNDVAVTGENKIERVQENENGNPQSTKTIDVTHIWPDEEFNSRSGTKVREWIGGSETTSWGDNVFLITGNWTNTFKDGTVYSSDITQALQREMACRFIVSGTIDIDKGEKVGVIDFGDGTCDNLAIFTDSEGEENEITLRKRKRKH
jgi:hypothetical protein